MTSAANVLRDAIAAALRHPQVALVAGVDPDDWARDPDEGGHVFEAGDSYILARNRGRLPFVTFEIADQSGHQLTNGGGDLTTKISGGVHVGGRDRQSAEALARDLSEISRTSIRTVPGNRFTFLGDDQEGEFGETPLGHVLPFTMEFRQTLTRPA